MRTWLARKGATFFVESRWIAEAGDLERLQAEDPSYRTLLSGYVQNFAVTQRALQLDLQTSADGAAFLPANLIEHTFLRIDNLTQLQSITITEPIVANQDPQAEQQQAEQQQAEQEQVEQQQAYQRFEQRLRPLARLIENLLNLKRLQFRDQADITQEFLDLLSTIRPNLIELVVDLEAAPT